MKRIIIFIAISSAIRLSAMEETDEEKEFLKKEPIMIEAIQKGMTCMIEDYGKYAMNPNAVHEGTTALHEAVKILSIKGVSALLSTGANPDTSDKNNCTPLMMLIDKFRGTQWCYDNVQGCFRLVHAISKNKDAYTAEKIAENLLEHGANPHAHIKNDKSPLGAAISLGWEGMIRILLSHKADSNRTQGNNGEGALAFVIRTKIQKCDCYNNIPRLLIRSGDRIDHKNNNGETALFDACTYPKVSILKMLLKAGANVHLRNKDGQSVLEKAIHHGTPKHVKLLKKYGATL